MPSALEVFPYAEQSKTIRGCQQKRDNQKHISHSMILFLANFSALPNRDHTYAALEGS
jgi:hypothetical protein